MCHGALALTINAHGNANNRKNERALCVVGTVNSFWQPAPEQAGVPKARANCVTTSRWSSRLDKAGNTLAFAICGLSDGETICCDYIRGS